MTDLHSKDFVYEGAPILESGWLWRLLCRIYEFIRRCHHHEIFRYNGTHLTVSALEMPVLALVTGGIIWRLWLHKIRSNEKKRSLSLDNRILHGHNTTMKVSLMLQSWTQDIIAFSKNDASVFCTDEELKLEYLDEVQKLRTEWTGYLSPLPDLVKEAFEDGKEVQHSQWFYFIRLWYASVRWARKDMRERIEELANVPIPGPLKSPWAHQFQLGVQSTYLTGLVDITDQLHQLEDTLKDGIAEYRARVSK